MTDPMQAPGEEEERHAGRYFREAHRALRNSPRGMICIEGAQADMCLSIAARILDPPPDDPEFVARLHRFTKSLDREIRNNALEEAARVCVAQAAWYEERKAKPFEPTAKNHMMANGAIRCANAIRDLKKSPTPEKP